MNFEIKQVHVESNEKHERSITKVKLGNGSIETVSQVVDGLDRGDTYYFNDSDDVVLNKFILLNGNPLSKPNLVKLLGKTY